MRVVVALLWSLVCARALAQEPPPPVWKPPVRGPLREPGTDVFIAPPPPVGSCVGGSCGSTPVAPTPEMRAYASQGFRFDRARDTRTRFAYAGALLGTVSAGLVLGGAIAIASVDDRESERITRGVWVGYMTATLPIVAISSMLARPSRSTSVGSKALRTTGWTAYAFAVTDGVVLWASAFRPGGSLDPLTIGAGAIGATALLAHAFDAFLVARARRVARYRAAITPTPGGFRVQF